MAETPASAPETAYFLSPSGEIVEASPEQAPAIAEVPGYQPASPQQIEDHELQKRHGGFGSQVITAAEQAASTLTFGASTWAERAAGVPAEDIAGRERANPVASLVGTGLGIAGALVPGLGEATAPGIISKLGAAATERVGAALGAEAATGFARVGGHAAAAAAGWGAEGAAYAAGNVVHEAALGDPNLTAQSAMAEIGLGGILGGAIGGLVGAKAGALPKALEGAKDAGVALYGATEKVATGAYRMIAGASAEAKASSQVLIENAVTFNTLEHAVPGTVKAVASSSPAMADWAAKNAEKLASAEASYPGLTKMMLNGTDPAHASFLLDNFEQMWRDTATRTRMAQAMTDGMDALIKETNSALRVANSEIIPTEARELIEKGTGKATPEMRQALGSADPEAVQVAYDKGHDSIREAVASMRAEPEMFAPGRIRKLELIADGLVRDAPMGAVEGFERLNTLKRQLDELIPYGTDMAAAGYSEKNVINEAIKLRRSVAEMITDEGIFGEAAARRAALNEAQANWLRLTQKGGDFRKAFMEGHRDASGKLVYTLKPSKMDTHLGQIVKLKGGADLRVWDEAVDAAKKLAEEIEKSAQHAPGAGFDKAALDDLINRSSDQTQKARLAATVTRGIREQNPAIPFGNGIAAPMHIAEAVAHHVPFGGTIVSTIKSAASVSAGVRVLAGLEHVGQAVGDKMDAAITSMLRKGTSVTAAGRREVAAGIGAVLGMSAAERVDDLDRKRKRLARLTASPEAFAEQLEKHAAPLTPHAPQTAQALQIATARAVQFLQSKLPQPPQDRGPLSPKWTPSQAEVARFQRYYEAVHDPISILKQAQNGSITPESIEAVRIVYPQLLQKMQAVAVERLTDPDLPPVSYKARLGLSALLGQSLDASATPVAVARHQKSFAGAPAAPRAHAPRPTQGGAGKLTIASRMATPGQASATRRR